VYEKSGRIREAIDEYNVAIRLRPDWTVALTDLARILASQNDPQLRNTGEAVKLAEKAAGLTQMRDLLVLETLTTAYAEDGRINEAARAAQMTAALASTTGDKELAAKMQERAKLYMRGRTQLEPSASPVRALE
jgi:cytochrome c-type biogenesis protein CcmH/NrfG